MQSIPQRYESDAEKHLGMPWIVCIPQVYFNKSEV